MAKANHPRRSSSGVGRFLLDVLKPAPAISMLGKRTREDDSDEPDNTRSSAASTSAPPTTVAAPAATSKRACIALQSEDPTEDAVVITALHVIPFCCHADLITMKRPDLLAVADVLNAKLPLAMRIDTKPSRSDVSIRQSIELLVGLRDPAPEPTRSQSLPNNTQTTTPRVTRKTNLPRSPTSPLASRTRQSLGTPSLAVLHEDSQEDRSSTRSPKRRRTSAPLPYEIGRPITRAQSRLVAPLLATNSKGNSKDSAPAPKAMGAAAGARLLRTRSTPVYRTSQHSPRRTGRARGTGTHASSKSTSRSSFAMSMTSTPKKRAAAAVNSPAGNGAGAGAARRFGSLLADIQIQNAGNVYGGPSASAKTRGRFGDAVAVGRDESIILNGEDVTFELDGLTIPLLASPGDQLSDMDISYG